MTDTAVSTILARLDRLEADVNARIDKFETEVNMRFAKLDTKLDEKPGVATVYQVSFAILLGLAAFAAAMTGMFKATGIIP